MSPTALDLKVDVVIVGGGPVGSLIAYQLARFGGKPYLLEQDDKHMMPCYGRATTMWPRTIELLDQIDIAERLIQLGVVTRTALHFRDGRRIAGGLMYGGRMDKLGDTFFKFALHLRQRIIEEQCAEALEEFGIYHHMRQKIEGYTIDEDTENDYPLTVRVRDLEKNEVIEVRAKYLVGADGGKSTVRKLASIPFTGDRTLHQWIRMDALVTTDMPNSRTLNSIDSASHGQILWCPIDDGRTRIGYVFSQALIEKYGGAEGVTKEVVVKEAKKALEPFKVEFLEVDWFTLYGIGQYIAEKFFTQDRVFLAGDACHTHSSGSAQGLNTGVHDAINLSWKLALRVRGLGQESLLSSYGEERRPIVEQIIDNDKTISMLISGQYPPRFEGRKEHPRDILTEWFSDVNRQAFTLGLGISYSSSVLNMENTGACKATINAGERGPDVYLTTIGTRDLIRLHQILRNEAKFALVVFAGIPHASLPSLKTLRASLSSASSFTRSFPASLFRWITICALSGHGAQEVLGIKPFGKTYFDESRKAHDIYGVDVDKGAIIVFRPDGWVGAVVGLDEVHRLGGYFEGFLEKSCT